MRLAAQGKYSYEQRLVILEIHQEGKPEHCWPEVVLSKEKSTYGMLSHRNHAVLSQASPSHFLEDNARGSANDKSDPASADLPRSRPERQSVMIKQLMRSVSDAGQGA